MFDGVGVFQLRQLSVHLPRAISHINLMAGTKAILRHGSSSGIADLGGLWCDLMILVGLV